jgi:hypothetical protein
MTVNAAGIPPTRIKLPINTIPGKNLIPSPHEVKHNIDDFIDDVKTIPTSIGAVTDLVGKILSNITSVAFWQRAGVFVLGGYLIWWGFIVIIGNTDFVKKTVKSAVSTGSKVAKVAA